MIQEDDIRALLDQGLTYYGLGDVAQAMEIWKKALAADPENARALEYVRFVGENWAPDQVRESEPYRPDEGSDPEGASLQQAGPPAVAESERATKSEPVDGAGQAGDFTRTSTLPPHPAAVQSACPEPSAFSLPPPEPVAPEPIRISPTAPFPAPSGEPKDSESALGPVGGGEAVETESALGLVGGGDADSAPDPTSDEAETLLKGAREMLDLDDFSGAIELLDKVLGLRSEHAEASRLREGAEVELVKLFRSKLGDFNQMPEVRMAGDEVIWLNLDHRAGFVLSLVDGRTSYEDILSVCGLSELEGMRILVQLVQEKVIDAN